MFTGEFASVRMDVIEMEATILYIKRAEMMKILLKYGEKKYFVFTILGLLVMSIEGFLLPYTIELVVNGLNSGSWQILLQGILFGVFGFIFVGIAGYGYAVSFRKFQKLFSTDITSVVYDHFLLNYKEDGDEKSSSTLSFVQNDIKLLEENYVYGIFTFMQAIVLAIVATIYIIQTNAVLGLIFIGFALLPMAIPYFTMKYVHESAKKYSVDNSEYMKELTEDIKGVATIKSYGQEKTFSKRLRKQALAAAEGYLNMVKAEIRSNNSSYTLSYIFSLIPLFIGGFFVLGGTLNVGQLLAVFMASDRIANPLQVAVANFNKIQTTKEIRRKIDLFESQVQASNEKEEYIPEESIMPISLKNVTIKYGEKTVLDRVNFDIDYGDKVLIIGESGAGKSTLLQSLQNKLEIDSGELTYAESKKDRSEVNHHVSYIRQSPMIFDDTIEFNLTLGEEYKETEVMKAVQLAGLEKLVQENGLDYEVGENGKFLSGGQNQRIEIARAILRRRELMIADEVTASLDKETAKAVRKTLFSLPQTVVEVSHHLDADQLSKYDRIYRVGNQKIRIEVEPAV